mgnify:CR=1 FL=1
MITDSADFRFEDPGLEGRYPGGFADLRGGSCSGPDDIFDGGPGGENRRGDLHPVSDFGGSFAQFFYPE